MVVNVEDVIAELEPRRRRKIKERGKELVAEEETRQAAQEAMQQFTAKLAPPVPKGGTAPRKVHTFLVSFEMTEAGGELVLDQKTVSNLERRSGESPLSKFCEDVEAIGGSLSLVVRWPTDPLASRA